MTIFLYDFLNKIIYIKQLYLFKFDAKLVYYLCKALYKLKQTLQVWYQTLANFQKKLKLKHLELNHDIFVSQDQQLFFVIYIDDLFFFDSNNFFFKNIQDQLSIQFNITNLEDIFHYSNIKIVIDIGKKISF